jgi:hypothetical protein
MTPLQFGFAILGGLAAFVGMVVLFAWIQHLIDTGLDDGPPEPPAGGPR